MALSSCARPLPDSDVPAMQCPEPEVARRMKHVRMALSIVIIYCIALGGCSRPFSNLPLALFHHM